MYLKVKFPKIFVIFSNSPSEISFGGLRQARVTKVIAIFIQLSGRFLEIIGEETEPKKTPKKNQTRIGGVLEGTAQESSIFWKIIHRKLIHTKNGIII